MGGIGRGGEWWRWRKRRRTKGGMRPVVKIMVVVGLGARNRLLRLQLDAGGEFPLLPSPLPPSLPLPLQKPKASWVG